MLTPFQKDLQERIFAKFGYRYGVDALKEISDKAEMRYLNMAVHLKKVIGIYDTQIAVTEELITGADFDETIKEIYLEKQYLPF